MADKLIVLKDEGQATQNHDVLADGEYVDIALIAIEGLMSASAGNVIRLGSDGKLYANNLCDTTDPRNPTKPSNPSTDTPDDIPKTPSGGGGTPDPFKPYPRPPGGWSLYAPKTRHPPVPVGGGGGGGGGVTPPPLPPGGGGGGGVGGGSSGGRGGGGGGRTKKEDPPPPDSTPIVPDNIGDGYVDLPAIDTTGDPLRMTLGQCGEPSGYCGDNNHPNKDKVLKGFAAYNSGMLTGTVYLDNDGIPSNENPFKSASEALKRLGDVDHKQEVVNPNDPYIITYVWDGYPKIHRGIVPVYEDNIKCKEQRIVNTSEDDGAWVIEFDIEGTGPSPHVPSHYGVKIGGCNACLSARETIVRSHEFTAPPKPIRTGVIGGGGRPSRTTGVARMDLKLTGCADHSAFDIERSGREWVQKSASSPTYEDTKLQQLFGKDVTRRTFTIDALVKKAPKGGSE